MASTPITAETINTGFDQYEQVIDPKTNVMTLRGLTGTWSKTTNPVNTVRQVRSALGLHQWQLKKTHTVMPDTTAYERLVAQASASGSAHVEKFVEMAMNNRLNRVARAGLEELLAKYQK